LGLTHTENDCTEFNSMKATVFSLTRYKDACLKPLLLIALKTINFLPDKPTFCEGRYSLVNAA
jgi:hypothetical protein